MLKEDCKATKGNGQEWDEESPDPVGQSLPMTVLQVCERWGITEEQLKLFVHHWGLPAYFKQVEGDVRVDASVQGTPLNKIHFWMFWKTDIEEFERNHPELLSKKQIEPEASETKLRPNQRHKERCRALAQYIWSTGKDKNTTIADMIKSEAIVNIGCEKKQYRDDTLRDWIKDLCPNRDPGRRQND